MNILHLEDDPLDAEMTRNICLGEWPGCQVKIVDNRAAFVEQLEAGGHDLILSDFNLTNFNGLEALQLAREKARDVPFLFLSGTIGEDLAIEALRAGAADYIIKDRPKRLIPAIQRALQTAQLAREHRIAEEQLQRVQRLENLGMLAAGIAHDFNNVLAPILMGAEVLRTHYVDPGAKKLLANMESSATRGVGLVKQILEFAHGATGAPQLIHPQRLIKDLVGVMQQTFPKKIEIRDETDRDLWRIKVNPTQFHQVLLNLCINARDAMTEGGVLTLRAANRSLDADAAAALPGARAGSYLLLEVSDTGMGIPADLREKIWEPFFSTKGEGQGTGLGLATVRGIIKEHDGVITLQSEPGRGTTFQILLPAVPGNGSGPGWEAVPETTPRGKNELLLVVDDDPSVRETTCAALAAHGYHVLAAEEGTEAVALLATRSLEVRLVVADMELPILDGVTLGKVAASLNPSIRILLVSGTAEASDVQHSSSGSVAFLQKPYSAEKLLVTVYKLLQRGDSSAL